MSWSTIRKATDEDRERLSAAALRFIERHQDEMPFLVIDEDTRRDPVFYLGCHIEPREDQDFGQYLTCQHLSRLWLGCVRRALREPTAEGIAYGYVGRYVD